MDGRKGGNWRFLKYEIGPPNRLRVDGPEMKKSRQSIGSKLDGLWK